MGRAEVRFGTAAQKAIDNNPNIDPRIIQEIASGYIQMDGIVKQEVGRMQQTPMNGGPPHKSIINRQSSKLQTQLYKNFRDDIVKKHGAQGEAALNAVNNEINPGISSIGKQFYDQGKGGWQTGGLIGAALGALAGLSMSGGGFGMMPMLIMAVMAIGGAWGGNKVSEYVSQAGNTQSPQAPSPGLAQQQAQAEGLTANGLPENVKKSCRECQKCPAPLRSGHHIRFNHRIFQWFFAFLYARTT